MKYNIQTITPQYAKELLTRNNNNRPINKIHVERLAKEMTEGRWKLNGDTICINENKIIDGQHRLSAVVLSGETIVSLVVDGLPSDVFDTKDIGKRRSAADTFSVLGKKNAKRLAAALVVIDKYVTGRIQKSVKYSNMDMENLLLKYPDVENSILTGVETKGLIPPSILDACHYLFSKKDPDIANEFVTKIIKGTGMQDGCPWYLLRERLVGNSLSKSKLPHCYIMALCIKAFNYKRLNADIKYLRWFEKGNNAESFPIIK